jgi:hypothetical protein
MVDVWFEPPATPVMVGPWRRGAATPVFYSKLGPVGLHHAGGTIIAQAGGEGLDDTPASTLAPVPPTDFLWAVQAARMINLI